MVDSTHSNPGSSSRFGNVPPLDPTQANGHGHATGPDAFAQLGKQFAEFKEYASYMVAAKADRFKVQIRNAVFWAICMTIGLIAAMAMVAVAATLVLIGISGGLTLLLDGRAWLANLITGAVVLIGLGIAVNMTLKKITHTFHSQLIARYEARKKQQAVRFGHDVEQAAHGRR